MAKITAMGGMFFKAGDHDALSAWYGDKLGLDVDAYGLAFMDNPGARAFSQWGMFKSTTGYFDPTTKDYMFNFRVDDLKTFMNELEARGVEETGERMEEEFGKFAWIMDPEGNKIELWQPSEGICQSKI